MNNSARRIRLRRATIVGCGVALSATLTGCGWTGLNQFSLPGAAASGSDAWELKVELPDVTTLTENARVRVADVNVGTVRTIAVEGDHALVTVSLEPDVVLPANTGAKIGSTSLLGSAHLELLPPENPEGELHNGDTIKLVDSEGNELTGAYPTTEQTLSTLSFLLNGGDIGKLEEINREVGLALQGREDIVRNLLTNVEDFTSRLNEQRDDLIRALDGLERFSKIVADDRVVVDEGLKTLDPALAELNKQRDNIAGAVMAIGDFGDAAHRVINGSRAELDANLRSLEPTLQQLANSGQSLPNSMSFLFTIPFPLNTFRNATQGDYANLFLNLDLTTKRVDQALLAGTPGAGALANLGGLIGQLPPIPPIEGNPLITPLTPGQGGN